VGLSYKHAEWSVLAMGLALREIERVQFSEPGASPGPGMPEWVISSLLDANDIEVLFGIEDEPEVTAKSKGKERAKMAARQDTSSEDEEEEEVATKSGGKRKARQPSTDSAKEDEEIDAMTEKSLGQKKVTRKDKKMMKKKSEVKQKDDEDSAHENGDLHV
jgi:hypothetical protein